MTQHRCLRSAFFEKKGAGKSLLVFGQSAGEEDREMDFTSAYQKAMTGDQEGFRFLYDSTAQSVYEFLLTKLGDQPKADQMIGKVYEQAWAGLGNLANPEEFPGWVYSIAENMVTQEKGSIPVPPIGGGEAAGASSGNALAGGEAGITPNVSHMSSPNAAHMSPNAAHASSPNVANMADGGIQQMSAGATGGQGLPGNNLASAGNQVPGSNLASAGKGAEAAATGSKAGAAGVKTAAAAGSSGAKATFLSTALGKVILGVGIAATATALGVGGYFVAKKINHKDEPTTESTEISSAEIETEASTDEAITTEITTEATTEAASTEEAKIDVHQLYVSYMNDVLIPERGVHKAEQDKTSAGMSNEGSFSELPGWFDGSGIYIADFDDYDGDGEEEMLVVSGEAFPMDGYYADYTENQYRMRLEMYDIRDEKVVLRDACETGYIYDGYEGGGFPYTLAKVKRDNGIFLFSIAAGGLSYRTDASTNASYKIYSTKEELRSLYELGFKCALGGGYKITCVDRRSDPSNESETTLVDISGQVDKNTSELTTGDDLKLPLYKEEVPNYFADWNIQLNDDFEVSDGIILMKMYIDYNNRKYHLIDNSGFHDADWGKAKQEGQTSEEGKTEEKTTEEAKENAGFDVAKMKQDYLAKIEAFENDSDHADYEKSYNLIYVNDDDIPELVCQYKFETNQTSQNGILYTWKDGEVIELGEMAEGLVECNYYPRKNYVDAGGGREEMGAVWYSTVWKINETGDGLEYKNYMSCAYDKEKYNSAMEADETAFNTGDWFQYEITDNGLVRIDGKEIDTSRMGRSVPVFGTMTRADVENKLK